MPGATSKRTDPPRTSTPLFLIKHERQDAVSGTSEETSASLNELVDLLCSLKRQHQVTFALRVGELVVQKLFEGDIRLLHRPGPKTRALSRLAGHPRLPFSSSTLSRAVGVYELVLRFPQQALERTLSLAQFYAVLVAPRNKQELLLRESLRHQWDAKRIRQEAARFVAKEGQPRRGRPARSPGLKALGTLSRVLQEGAPLRDLAFVEQLSPDQIRAMRLLLEQTQAWCHQAAPLLEQRLSETNL